MKNYTPGPWCVPCINEERAQRRVVNGDCQIAIVNGGPAGGIGAANARLIAAAPDMLDALKAALRVLETARRYFPKSVSNSDTFTLLNVSENSVRRAIAKAEDVPPLAETKKTNPCEGCLRAGVANCLACVNGEGGAK